MTLSPVAICLSTLVGSVVSGFVPVVNAEVLLLTVIVASPPELAPLLVLVCTLGQMAAKTTLYLGAWGVGATAPGRAGEAVRRIAVRLKERPVAGRAVLFLSASIGLPPFYVTTLAAGVVRMGLPAFLTLGFTGRLLRFGTLAAAPHFLLTPI